MSLCTYHLLRVVLCLACTQHRGSNPAVEAEYQSYPAAGRLTSLVKGERALGVLCTCGEFEGAATASLRVGISRTQRLAG